MAGGVDESVVAQLHPLEVRVLPFLRDKIALSALAKKAKLQEVEAMRACQWLENKKALSLKPLVKHELALGKNGKHAPKVFFDKIYAMSDECKKEIEEKSYQAACDHIKAFKAEGSASIVRKSL